MNSDSEHNKTRKGEYLLIGVLITLAIIVGFLLVKRIIKNNKSNIQEASENSIKYYATYTPNILPSLAPTKFSTSTPVPIDTVVILPTSTVSSMGVEEVAKTNENYPLVSIDDLYANSQSYYLQRFLIDGTLVDFGYIPVDGNSVFVLQVGVGNYINPIIVLNLSPNSSFIKNERISIWGYGAGSVSDANSPSSDNIAPLMIGEWWETSNTQSQWNPPSGSWIPIP